MLLRKHYLLLVALFMGIFTAKMVISGAPVFFAHLDKDLMNAVIMQLEQENHDDSGKDNVKFADHKLMFHRYDLTYVPVVMSMGMNNSFIEHSRRYVDPYHPSVPTPPPNYA